MWHLAAQQPMFLFSQLASWQLESLSYGSSLSSKQNGVRAGETVCGVRKGCALLPI